MLVGALALLLYRARLFLELFIFDFEFGEAALKFAQLLTGAGRSHQIAAQHPALAAARGANLAVTRVGVGFQYFHRRPALLHTHDLMRRALTGPLCYFFIVAYVSRLGGYCSAMAYLCGKKNRSDELNH